MFVSSRGRELLFSPTCIAGENRDLGMLISVNKKVERKGGRGRGIRIGLRDKALISFA